MKQQIIDSVSMMHEDYKL